MQTSSQTNPNHVTSTAPTCSLLKDRKKKSTTGKMKEICDCMLCNIPIFVSIRSNSFTKIEVRLSERWQRWEQGLLPWCLCLPLFFWSAFCLAVYFLGKYWSKTQLRTSRVFRHIAFAYSFANANRNVVAHLRYLQQNQKNLFVVEYSEIYIRLIFLPSHQIYLRFYLSYKKSVGCGLY